MINVTAEELQRILKILEDALTLHDKWREALQRTLACRLPVAESILAEDAHYRCAFGQWFYGEANAPLRRMPAFAAIGELHEAMHSHARRLGRKAAAEAPPAADYDRWHAAVAQFREALMDLRQKTLFTLQNVDALTGTLTQQRLLPDLRQEQQKLKGNGAPYSLLLVDIDVRAVNQSRGREIGDQVLRQSVLKVKESLAEGDTIYRYGGAEFVICLPKRGREEAERIKERLLKRIGEAAREVVGEALPSLQIQYSIVALDPEAYIEELLDRAAYSTYTIDI